MKTKTYTNPVYSGYFADPYAWRHKGIYYAIGTGVREATGATSDERVIPLLKSPDLVEWTYVGHVLHPPDAALGGQFWAPETAYNDVDGKHYLYYSVGEDVTHQLRVAASSGPEGPYRDIHSKPLIDPEVRSFAIDSHAFRDDDGQWYLFYARDFLDTADGNRAGTAIVVDRLIDMSKLAGEEHVVLRSRYDWQRYLANRPIYGGIYDWHTLEGPCVRKHDGRYYCFYSGGRWETDGYGIDYCVAERVTGPYFAWGAENGPRVLRTVPGKVLGPGHNSIVIGPDDRTEFIVYHAWDPAKTARRMCIDPLIWTKDGPRCEGPSFTPRAVVIG